MSLGDDARDLLAHWRAPDTEQERLRAAYVDHLDADPDGLWRSCLPDHLTAGALVLSDDAQWVLLNLHRKSGHWFHFGGHLEPTDATLAGAALRETVEESGIAGVLVGAEPLHLSCHEVPFCAPGPRVRHLDVRFLARVDRAEEPVVSEESLAVRWWPVAELPTDQPDMVALVRLALAQ